MYSFDDINDQWAFFHTILVECLDRYLPLHNIHSRRSKKGPLHGFQDISDLIKLTKRRRRGQG